MHLLCNLHGVCWCAIASHTNHVACHGACGWRRCVLKGKSEKELMKLGAHPCAQSITCRATPSFDKEPQLWHGRCDRRGACHGQAQGAACGGQTRVAYGAQGSVRWTLAATLWSRHAPLLAPCSAKVSGGKCGSACTAGRLWRCAGVAQLPRSVLGGRVRRRWC